MGALLVVGTGMAAAAVAGDIPTGFDFADAFVDRRVGRLVRSTVLAPAAAAAAAGLGRGFAQIWAEPTAAAAFFAGGVLHHSHPRDSARASYASCGSFRPMDRQGLASKPCRRKCSRS